MDYCWKCGGPMSKNSRERVCRNCGRRVQRHKNSSQTYDDSASRGGGLLGTLLFVGLMGVAVAVSSRKRSSDDIEIPVSDDSCDYSYSLAEADARRKRNAMTSRDRKDIAICFLSIILAATIFCAIYVIITLVPLGCDSNSLVGIKYTEVIRILKDSGFTNIHTEEISDLPTSREDEDNIVTEVKLLHTSTFGADKKYPSNFRITVVYHTIKLYAPPITSKEAKGMNYEEVIAKFENAGFTNIRVEVKYDIITGWINNDGEVKTITINGNSEYNYYDEYRPDAQVVITYHTLLSNEPK